MELLRNPRIASDFLKFTSALQCNLASLYLSTAMILIRDCWLQQQEIRDIKRSVLQELKTNHDIRAKTSEFVDCAQSLQAQHFQAITKDDLSYFAKDFFQTLQDFQRTKASCRVDIVYHHTRRENLTSIRSNSLFFCSQCKDDNSVSSRDGIYCSSDPFIFSNQRYGGTVIMLARIKTIELSSDNAAGTTLKPYSDQFVPLKGFCVIHRSNECVPLFQFPSRLFGNRNARFEKLLVGFQERVQQLLINQFFKANAPSEYRKCKGQLSFLDRKLPTVTTRDTKMNAPANIRNDDRARKKFMQSQAFKAYRALCVSEHRNREASTTTTIKPKQQVCSNLKPLWSHLETPGMRQAKCSLLIQNLDSFHPQTKRLKKQKVRVYQDRGYISEEANCDTSVNQEDKDFYVDFEGCTILQFEPSRGVVRQTMPITLTVGGRCVFTPENYRDFSVMMRTKEQAKDMNLLPNGDFEWPGVESLQLCPMCGRTAEIPQKDDDQNHEYWLLFYPLLQITMKKGSQMMLGSRMICRLTCLGCMHELVGDTTCEVCPPLLNERKSKISFRLPTKEVLGDAGSVSFLEGGPPRTMTSAKNNNVLDAWTLYNLWEHSGAWEALQNDYRLFLSKSMS